MRRIAAVLLIGLGACSLAALGRDAEKKGPGKKGPADAPANPITLEIGRTG